MARVVNGRVSGKCIGGGEKKSCSFSLLLFVETVVEKKIEDGWFNRTSTKAKSAWPWWA